MLCNTCKENKSYTYTSSRFNVFHGRLDTFKEMLTLDDDVMMDEITQPGTRARSNRSTDELMSSTI